MMMPLQIYCDYLEDKGIDTRLLRTQESEGLYINSICHAWSGFEDGFEPFGDGYSWSYGNTLGDGESCGTNERFLMYQVYFNYGEKIFNFPQYGCGYGDVDGGGYLDL